MGSAEVRDSVLQWRIRRDWASRGHQPISFQYGSLQGRTFRPWRGAGGRFVLQRADWDGYRTALRTFCPRLDAARLDTRGGVLQLASGLTAAVRAAAARAIPRSRPGRPSVPWWTDHLAHLKAQAHRLRRAIQREREDEARWLVCRNRYRLHLRRYEQAVKETKDRSWRNFVVTDTDGDQWGRVYRISARRIDTKRAAVAVGGDEVVTWEESARHLLDGLVIDDVEADDTAAHTLVRQGLLDLPVGREVLQVTEADVLAGLRHCRRGKAPGPDGIVTQLLSEGWDELRRYLARLYTGCFRFGIFPTAWKRGKIVALLKAEDHPGTEVDSYRPICLLSAVGKLFERVIAAKLENVFTEAISERQFGL